MKLLRDVIFALHLICLLTSAADPAESSRQLLPGHQDILVTLASLSFRDLICSSIASSKNDKYMMALSNRPEFRHIDWQEEDCGELARQLWTFQLEESDRSYHMALAKVLAALMSHHGLPAEKIKKVRSIMSTWVKARGSKLHMKQKVLTES